MSDQFYTCKKCGTECLIEFDAKENYRTDAWCDKCNDYPGGWEDAVDDIQVSMVGATSATTIPVDGKMPWTTSKYLWLVVSMTMFTICIKTSLWIDMRSPSND